MLPDLTELTRLLDPNEGEREMPTISLTLDSTQAARVTRAMGKYQNLKDAEGSARDATQAEIKAWIVRQLRGVVVQQERREAEAALAAPTDLTVT